MTNYREILRLDSLGLNKTQIAEACGCSRTTVMHKEPSAHRALAVALQLLNPEV